jgi:phosphatidylinositol alpha-mannosyltransferase
VVVGQGDPSRYQRFLEQNGVEDTIFAGYVDAETLPRYYASCDVFCAPSTGRESFGVILLEAMATGKPVVAGANAGYSAVVRNGIDGLLVEPKDAQGLALAIVRVLADTELREMLRVNGLERVKEFSWEVVDGQVMRVYERAAAASAAGPVPREWPEFAGRR